MIEAETKTNSAPDDISSGLRTDSNPITDSIIKSDIDVIDKQGEQSIDMEPKEKSYQAPHSILLTPENTVSEPEDDCNSPPIDQSDSAMHTLSANDCITVLSSDPPVKALVECELKTVSDSANDMSHLTGEEINDCQDHQDKSVVDVILEPKNDNSDFPYKTLGECELETDDDPTNDPSREMDNDQLDEYVGDSQDTPVVDVILEQGSIGSDSPDEKLGEFELKIDNILTNDLSPVIENNQIGEPVSDCQDLPVGDVLFEPRDAVGELLKSVNSLVCVKDPLSDIKEQPTCDNFSKLSEPAKKQADLFSDQPDDLFSEMLNDKVEQQSSVFSASLTDACLEAKNTLIAGPLSDDPPSDIFSKDCVAEVTSPTSNSDTFSESLKRDDDEQDIFTGNILSNILRIGHGPNRFRVPSSNRTLLHVIL